MTVAEKPNRTRRRKAARPGEIVSAGIDEFAEHGFERARLDRIAAKAGIAKGTIYLYFPSKEALFTAAVEEHVISVMDENEATLDSFEGNTEDLLRHLLKNVYGKLVTTENQALMRILVSESHRLPGLVQTYHDMALKRGSKLLARIIERGIARGEIKESAATRTPELVIAPALFVCLHNMIFAAIDPIDVDAFFEGHIELVMRGLRG